MRFDRSTSLGLVCLAALLAVGGQASIASAAQVDLELVLAVDSSASMSKAELHSQRQGYVDALRHTDFALALAMRGGVALTYVEWAGPYEQKVVVPWTVVGDASDAARFAERLTDAPLHPDFGWQQPWDKGTSISQALIFAAGLFEHPHTRHVIDISGNGPNNIGGSLDEARAWVINQGITINGLPIPARKGPDAEFPLATYYEDCVIGGPGAFALVIKDAAEFSTAIRRKLVLEIAGLPMTPTLIAFTPEAPARVDCDAPEQGH